MPRIGGNQSNPERHPTDLYPTNPAWTEALLDQVHLRGAVWECAAGNGDMVRVLEARGYLVRATDLLAGCDFLKQTAPWPGSIVTNPPYSLAEEFVAHAIDLGAEQVAMLLPIGFLGSQRRFHRLWSVRPPTTVIIISSRMIVNGAASQFNHCWCVFDQLDPARTELRWVL
jgi:hypothetical protein